MPDFHYATWKGSQAFSPWQQWGRKEGTLVIYGTGKDLTAHQIHFDGSYRSKCTAGDNIVRLRSGFLALFGKADTIVSTLLSVAESVCVCVCVCHLTVVIIMHTAGRLDELIPLWYTHARALALKKSSASLMEQGRQDAWRAHASGAGDSSVWRRLAENFKVKFKCPAPRLADTHTHQKNSPVTTRSSENTLFCQTWGLKETLTSWCTDVYMKSVWSFSLWWYFLTFWVFSASAATNWQLT